MATDTTSTPTWAFEALCNDARNPRRDLAGFLQAVAAAILAERALQGAQSAGEDTAPHIDVAERAQDLAIDAGLALCADPPQNDTLQALREVLDQLRCGDPADIPHRLVLLECAIERVTATPGLIPLDQSARIAMALEAVRAALAPDCPVPLCDRAPDASL